MKDYLRERLVIEARHAIELAEQQGLVQHDGLRGRLRELIAQRLIRPWLPPYVGCGTGTVIKGMGEEILRASTQEDLVLFDRTLIPPILIDESQNEGVFLTTASCGGSK